MPTIDELVLKVTTDNAQFSKALAGIQEDMRKAKDQLAKQGQGIEETGNKISESMRGVRANTLALYATIATAGFAVTKFVQEITTADMRTRMWSSNMGVSVRELAGWGGAARRAGASGESLIAALSGIQEQFAAYNVFGEDSPILAQMQRMGLQFKQTKDGLIDLQQLMIDVHEWQKGLDAPTATLALQRLGFPPDIIPFLRGTDEAFRRFIEDARNFSAETKDIKAATDRTEAFSRLKDAMTGVSRSIATDFTPTMVKLADGMTEWAEKNKEVAKTLQEIVLAMGLLGAIKPALWLLRMMGIGPVGLAVGAAGGTLGAAFLANEWANMKLDDRAKALGFQKQGGSWWNPFNKIPSYFNPQTGEKLTYAQMRDRAANMPEPSRQRGGASGDSSDAIDFFMGKGLSREAAAGIVGNLIQESGLNTQADNGSHVGVAQWDETRQAAIETHFGKSLKAMSNREQYEALWWEMNSGRDRGAAQALDALKGKGTAEEHAATFNELFERSGEDPGNRADLAERARRQHELRPPATKPDDAAEPAPATPATPAAPSQPFTPAKPAEGSFRKWLFSSAPAPDPSIMPGAAKRSAFASMSTTNNTTSSAETHINGPINIQTAAKDADGIARDIGSSLRKYAFVQSANVGLT